MPPRQPGYGSLNGVHPDETAPLQEVEAPRKKATLIGRGAMKAILCAIGILAAVVVVLRTSAVDTSALLPDPVVVGPPMTLTSLSPEELLGLEGVERVDGANPSEVWGDVKGPLPTNSWYLVSMGSYEWSHLYGIVVFSLSFTNFFVLMH